MSPLPADRLRLVTDPERLPFETTANLPEPSGPVGQDRAMRALAFGAGLAQPGYNIFVSGPADSGKHTNVRRALERVALSMPAPPDIAYVHNFAQPHRPRLLRFAAGEGAAFRKEMSDLAAALKTAMPRLFGSEDYQRRRTALEDEYHRAAEETVGHIRHAAESRGLALVENEGGGFDFEPCRDGLILPSQQVRTLPRPERDQLLDDTRALRRALDRATEVLEGLRLRTLDRVRALDREMGEAALRRLVTPVSERHAKHREAHAWLEEAFRDLSVQVETLQALARGEEEGRNAPFHRYEVNLIVDHSAARGAPVVTLAQASLSQLAGKVEHVPVLMAMVTDFMFIRPGALHQANGGFLLIDAMDLFRHDAAWDVLKRALRSRQARIENLAEMMDRSQAVTIQPEPVPLDVKIVLFGEAWVYQRLCQFDPEFAGLFKVQADFSAAAPRDDAHCEALLSTAAAIAHQSGLKQLDRGGAARLIDEASRQTGDAEKISVRTGRLADLLREADHFAGRGGRSLIAADDIAQAVSAKDDRLSRIKALDYELIQRGIVFIDTDGEKAGQVNGLTVLSAAGHAFGLPARITARAHPGNGSVTDIERISSMGGPSHTKGVHILSGYLNGAYSNGRPLSVSASVAFEQFYGRIDGDSASAAELIAILSAIADVPLKQSIAITGSINQHGQIQPIGGANEKIEGFFDVCAARGLATHHGVIIPKANVTSLMLREDVVEAARAGRFSVHAVETVDEAIEILSGMAAGVRRKGQFPRGSFNRRVEDRLIDFARPRVLKPVRLDGRRWF